jgi:hypothetical protein
MRDAAIRFAPMRAVAFGLKLARTRDPHRELR